MYENIPKSPIRPYDRSARLADGSPLCIDGKVILEQNLGLCKAFTTLLVANVSNDGILGLDNLSKMGANIDLTNFQISTEWGNVDCVKEDGERSYLPRKFSGNDHYSGWSRSHNNGNYLLLSKVKSNRNTRSGRCEVAVSKEMNNCCWNTWWKPENSYQSEFAIHPRQTK